MRLKQTERKTKADAPLPKTEGDKTLEGEQAALGAILLSVALDDNEAVNEIAGSLSVDDFYYREHRLIYDEIRSLLAKGRPPDVVLLIQALRDKGIIDKVGGDPYILGLVDQVPSTACAKQYATLVLEKSLLRKVGILCDDGQTNSRNGIGLEGTLNRLEDGLRRIKVRIPSRPDEGISPAREVIDDMVEELELWQSEKWNWRDNVILTGVRRLDEKLHGLRRSEMSVVKAKRSRGKTAFGVQVANNAINGGKGAIYVSAEMSKKRILQRFSVLRTGVTSDARRSTRLSERELAEIFADLARPEYSSLHVQFEGCAEVSSVIATVEAQLTQTDIWLVVVDYIQRFTQAKAESHEREVSIAGNAFASLAARRNIHVMVLSQINEAGEARWSKEVEDAADVAIWIHKENPWDKWCNLIVQKNRDGETGEVQRVTWNGTKGELSDPARGLSETG